MSETLQARCDNFCERIFQLLLLVCLYKQRLENMVGPDQLAKNFCLSKPVSHLAWCYQEMNTQTISTIFTAFIPIFSDFVFYCNNIAFLSKNTDSTYMY